MPPPSPHKSAPASPHKIQGVHQGADEGAGGEARHWLEPVEEQDHSYDRYERHPMDPLKMLEEAESAIGQRSGPQVEHVSDEVMRLRLLKSQHDELRAKLSHSQAQLKQKVTPHAVLRLHSYLEKNLGEPGLAEQVQEAVLRLVECLCAATRIKVAATTPEALLAGARRLLRDPHTLAGKLASMRSATSDEAKALAPFLLSTTAYVPVREKEVNTCYEVLHAWLSAFYFYSLVADQAGAVAYELSKQEKVLLRMRGHVDEAPSACSSQPTSKAGSPRGDGVASRPRLARPRGADLTTPLCRSRASLAGPASAACSAQSLRQQSPTKPRRPLGSSPSSSQTSLRAAVPAPSRGGAASPSAPAPAAHVARPGVTRRVSHIPSEAANGTTSKASTAIGNRSPLTSRPSAANPRLRRFDVPSTTGPAGTVKKASIPQRVQSDRVLTQCLQGMKRGLREGLSNDASVTSLKEGIVPNASATPGAPLRPATILERRSSLPETLLQSIHGLRALAEEATKDDSRLSWSPASVSARSP